MTAQRRTVFNRPDCPYGCGTSLAPNLRWQATPCRGCGRPLYPVAAVVDHAGRHIWPPATVPPPPLAVPVEAEFWYVVGEDEAAERIAILRETSRQGTKPDDGCLVGVVTILGFAVIAIADVVWRAIRAVLRR